MFKACGCESWALHDYMLDGLEGFAALAGNLILSVLGKESSCVFTYESMSGDEMIKCTVG